MEFDAYFLCLESMRGFFIYMKDIVCKEFISFKSIVETYQFRKNERGL